MRSQSFELIESFNTLNVKLIKSVRSLSMEVVFQAMESEMIPEKKIYDKLKKEYASQKQELAQEQGTKSRATLAQLESAVAKPKLPVEFAIVLKNPSGKGLIVDCTTKEGVMNVVRVTYHRRADAFAKGYLKGKVYGGPQFVGKKRMLAMMFKGYLESLGINKGLLKWIEVSAYNKKSALDVKWMEDLRSHAVQRGVSKADYADV